LAKAADEAAMVIERIPGDLIVPASVEMLDKFLREDKRSLIHFVCHGKSEDGQQVLVLQGQESIQPYFLRGMGNLERALRDKRPLIFLNACEIGRLEPGLVGMGGFAETFMKLGAGGVVAALWAIEDKVAHKVAEEFYRRVKESPFTPFAAILRDLRRRAYENGSDEDTWAAYCFYGDPLATASVSERQF
jgi:CHAT domain-containing protein